MQQRLPYFAPCYHSPGLARRQALREALAHTAVQHQAVPHGLHRHDLGALEQVPRRLWAEGHAAPCAYGDHASVARGGALPAPDAESQVRGEGL